MSESLVGALGIGPKVWLFLALLSCLTFYFKFSRFWSVRNLDMLLLFALGPAMVRLVGSGYPYPWWAFFWLFVGSSFWLVRCFVDLALIRRPVLEPNLNNAGLACMAIGVLGLLLVETVDLRAESGRQRNPASPESSQPEGDPPLIGKAELERPVKDALEGTPLPEALKRSPLQVILSRVLALLSHLGIVAGLYLVGDRHFQQRTAGLAAATCYLLLPYTRIAVVDSGQLFASALIVISLLIHQRAILTGLMLGLATAWMPACVGLIPIWAVFHRQQRASMKFLAASIGFLGGCLLLARLVPGVADWSHALLARSLAEAGLDPLLDVAPPGNSFWSGIDPIFRLPVLIAYAAFVACSAFLPFRKDLTVLISQSAAVLVASQYWFLEGGGTLILIYLPLLLLMTFRPSRAIVRAPRIRREGSYTPRPVSSPI
ncbi:MAG: hypothetical protein U0790_00650 [Isosphaeraceae bacterium]